MNDELEGQSYRDPDPQQKDDRQPPDDRERPAMTSERFDWLRANCNGNWVNECLDEIARLAKIAYVPGGWYCPKCKFQLTTSVIYVRSGNVGIDHRKPEACPNDGIPMLPQTYKHDATAMAERMPDALAMGMIHDLRKNEGASVTVF